MKYVAIDIESTGLDPANDQLLELALVLEDTSNLKPIEELPHINVIVRRERFTGQAVALAMNATLLQRIHDSRKWDETGSIFPAPACAVRIEPGSSVLSCDPDSLSIVVGMWLDSAAGRGAVTAAGKNAAGFDLQFLPAELRRRFRHRVIDPGSVFVQWSDETLPDLGTIKRRLGMPEAVAHTALEDARDVVRVLRHAPGYWTAKP